MKVLLVDVKMRVHNLHDRHRKYFVLNETGFTTYRVCQYFADRTSKFYTYLFYNVKFFLL